MFNLFRNKAKEEPEQVIDYQPITEQYGTAEDYLETRTLEQLRFRISMHVHNHWHFLTAYTLDDVMEFGYGQESALSLIWREYVRRRGPKAYTELKKKMGDRDDDTFTRSIEDRPISRPNIYTMVEHYRIVECYPLNIVIEAVTDIIKARFEGSLQKDLLRHLHGITIQPIVYGKR